MGKTFVFFFCDEYCVNVFRFYTSLLAGGAMERDGVVQPVLLCFDRNDAPLRKCETIQQSYSSARIYAERGFFEAVLKPLVSYDLSQRINAGCCNRQLSVMLPLMPLYKDLIDGLHIDDDDFIKFVLPIGTDEFAVLAYESFIAQLKSSFSGSFRCICILKKEFFRNQYHYQNTATLQFLGNLYPTIFVGSVRDDVQHPLFMQIRAAAAIVYNADNHVGFASDREHVGTIYHTIGELFCKDIAKSFLSAYLLGKSVANMADYYGHLGNKIGVNVEDDELAENLVAFFSERLIFDENVFMVDPEEICMKSVLEKMHKMKCFSARLTQVERRNLFMQNLLSSIIQASNNYVDALYFEQNPFRALSCQTNYIQCALTATYVYDETDIAFSQSNYDDTLMKKVRSLCMDFWEVFYRVSRESICNVFSVAEVVRLTSDIDSKLLLNLSDSGKKVLLEKYSYVVECEGHYVLSSPLTGFCFELDKVDYWLDKTKQLLNRDNDELELNERDLDLRKFIYCYTKMHDSFFSSTFRTYIENSIEEAIRQSISSNIFKEFSQYRKHIGIDIPD